MTRGLRVAAWVLTAAALGTLAVRYPSLPEVVPTHFDAAGRVDEVGGRSSLLWLALVWVVLQAGIGWLSAHPHVGNYPVEVVPENAQRLYRDAERLLVWLGVAIAAVFCGVLGLVVTGDQAWSLLITGALVALVGSTVVVVVRMLR